MLSAVTISWPAQAGYTIINGDEEFQYFMSVNGPEEEEDECVQFFQRLSRASKSVLPTVIYKVMKVMLVAFFSLCTMQNIRSSRTVTKIWVAVRL